MTVMKVHQHHQMTSYMDIMYKSHHEYKKNVLNRYVVNALHQHNSWAYSAGPGGGVGTGGCGSLMTA